VVTPTYYYATNNPFKHDRKPNSIQWNLQRNPIENTTKLYIFLSRQRQEIPTLEDCFFSCLVVLPALVKITSAGSSRTHNIKASLQNLIFFIIHLANNSKWRWSLDLVSFISSSSSLQRSIISAVRFRASECFNDRPKAQALLSILLFVRNYDSP